MMFSFSSKYFIAIPIITTYTTLKMNANLEGFLLLYIEYYICGYIYYTYYIHVCIRIRSGRANHNTIRKSAN